MDQRPIKMPQRNALCGVPSLPNSNTFNNAFQLNHNSILQNQIFGSIAAKMHRSAIEAEHVSMSSPRGSPGYSTVDESSSDSAFNSNRTRSPPPLRYFEPNRFSADRSSGIHSTSASPSSSEVDETPEKLPIARPGEVNSLCTNPWLPQTMRADVAQLVGQMFNTVQDKSNRDKEHYLKSRAGELQIIPEFNPNKRRLSNAYKSVKEAADRKKNNEASRESRLKRKCELKKTAMQMDFHRQENVDMYFLHNWIEQEVYSLETMNIDRGEGCENIYQLRRLYGFFPQQLQAEIVSPRLQN